MRPLRPDATWGSFAWLLILISYIYLLVPFVCGQGVGEPGGTCSDAIPCYQGCCSKENQCGFTDSHCGDGCKHNCNATAECGEFAAPGYHDCPINVCCSEHGYCGVTEGFCGDGCQPNSNGEGCGVPDRPQCSENTDALSYQRRIAYYELFHLANGCNERQPENIIVAPFTHINLAFVNFGSDFRLVDEDGDVVNRMSILKFDNAGLKINIAVGGWAFSDAPTQYLWSQMASTYPNRQVFIESVIKYLRDYHLDGVDLDWEYPAATDRGGNPDDIDNLVNLLAELREAFDREDPGWEISVTLPTSYWYLRGFDMERMQKYVDYFNMMTYDLHGMWDQDIEWTGPYLRGHTDIEQIDQGLDLLWRNGVRPENVVFGLAFYGRSFTMDNPTCYEPNGVCQFSDGGRPGTCSDTSGILTFAEVSARNHSLDVDTFYDPDTTVKYNTYEGDQWISYDDAQSFHDKKKFLTERCLSGLMIWAIDQDDGDFNALSGVFGADISDLQLSGGGLDDNAKDALADIFGSFTGQDCFATPRCTDGSSREANPDQVCPSGFTSITTAHNPLQAPGHERHGDCAEGWYRHICCPKKALPQNCEWNGAPERSSFGCNGQCGEHQFQLNQDTALDAKGEGSCFTGHRSLCCDSTAAIYSCKWTECQGPFTETELPSCPSDQTYMTYRLDKPNGKPWCSDTFVNVDGFHGWPPHYTMKSALCCPKTRTPRGCSWTNDNFDLSEGDNAANAWDLVCKPQQCPSGTVAFARALHPATSKAQLGNSGISCDAVEISPHTAPEFSFCCDPPSRYNQDWPVDPKMLWEHYYNDPEDSDVVWKYSNEYNKNNNDEHRAAPGAEDGTDAYGFVMLDGPEGSIDNSFADTQTVVRRSPTISDRKRSVVTTNQTLMDEVFDHSEETLHIYCNYPAGSRECERIFIDGAEDTIIRLPDHIGEGPFARIVSMKPAHAQYDLPDHHLEHRRVKRNENPIYEVQIDYNFHLIHPKRADEPVNIRVDYTNLLDYWGEMTNSPASRMKRGIGDAGLTQAEWKDRVKRASARQHAGRSRSETPVHVNTGMEMPEGHVQKRWWGAFREWLAKLTTVTKSELGVIPLGWARTFPLFYAQSSCPGASFHANLRVDLEANLVMDATYAYYLSGTFIPPSKPEAFAYFGMSPTAYLGLHIEGNARYQSTTGRKKIIDTLAYPGLAVKGIAAVGPTLDVYGEIRGVITLHGEVDAGAQVSFGKAEVYWPQNEDAKDEYEKLLGLESDTQSPGPFSVEPVFEAGVAVDAQLDIEITPEASIGIKIGGGKLVGGTMIMDAQLHGYFVGDLSFQAHGDYSTSTNEIRYSFGAYFIYNIGYTATAQILGLFDWALGPRVAYPSNKSIELYYKEGSIPLSAEQGASSQAIGQRSFRPPPPDEAPEDRTGSNTSLWLNPASHLHPRADGDQSGRSPQFSQPLTCPAGSSGDVQVPELRYNCYHLWDISEANKDQTAVVGVPGLCKSIVNLPDNKRQTRFTFSKSPLVGKRRQIQCPKQPRYCAPAEAALNRQLGRSGKGILPLQCDEFPWASSEQGGAYLASDRRTATCVPAYQNNWHGQCIQKIIGRMVSNWAKLEPDGSDGDDREDYWVDWQSTERWTAAREYGEGDYKYRQRLIQYAEDQPLPDGIASEDKRNNDKKQSWAFKRDYDVSWLNKQIAISKNDWWETTSQAFVDAGHGTVGAPEDIFCAVNHFGQDDVYRFPVSKSGHTFNAMCFRPPDKREDKTNGWPGRGNIHRCIVEFQQPDTGGGAAGDSSKREWTVNRVIVLDDEDDDDDDEAGFEKDTWMGDVY